MAKSAIRAKIKTRTAFPQAESIPQRWLDLCDDIRADIERAPTARLFHALQLRVGIHESDDDPTQWRWLLENCSTMPPHESWFNSLPRRDAKRGVQHCPLGKLDAVTADLIRTADDLVRTDPLMSGLGTDNFRLVLFLVGLARPQRVSYCIEQDSFQQNGSRLGLHPFHSLDAFESWENSKIKLKAGRYFLWLNRDVRKCAVSAIHALFDMPEKASDKTTPLPKLGLDPMHNKISIDGVTYDVEPHEKQFLQALVDAKMSDEWWVTGPQMQDYPGCRGKKISREIKRLETKIPALTRLMRHGGNKGYRLTE